MYKNNANQAKEMTWRFHQEKLCHTASISENWSKNKSRISTSYRFINENTFNYSWTFLSLFWFDSCSPLIFSVYKCYGIDWHYFVGKKISFHFSLLHIRCHTTRHSFLITMSRLLFLLLFLCWRCHQRHCVESKSMLSVDTVVDNSTFRIFDICWHYNTWTRDSTARKNCMEEETMKLVQSETSAKSGIILIG